MAIILHLFNDVASNVHLFRMCDETVTQELCFRMRSIYRMAEFEITRIGTVPDRAGRLFSMCAPVAQQGCGKTGRVGHDLQEHDKAYAAERSGMGCQCQTPGRIPGLTT